MKEDYLKFAEWVAEQITIEKLEYDFSDGLWFYENAMGEIRQLKNEPKGKFVIDRTLPKIHPD